MPQLPEKRNVLRILVDTNAFDDLAGNPHIIKASAEGRLLMFTTHVQEGEINQIGPFSESGQHFLSGTLPRTQINTSGAAFGTSLWGAATFAAIDTAKMINTVAGPRRKHMNDALILSTASSAQIPLVTADKRLRNQAQESCVEVMWAHEIIAMFRQ